MNMAQKESSHNEALLLKTRYHLYVLNNYKN